MHIGKRMRSAAERSGLTQQEIADRMGISRQALVYYFDQPGAPKESRLIAFCDIVHCSVQEIIDAKPGVGKIPVYGSIAAGIPIEAIEDISDYEEVSTETYRNIEEYFALKIKGGSMSPKISNGDIVIFHKQEDCESGDICAVLVNGEDATCKQVMKTNDGIVLHSLNECYGDICFNNDQISMLPVQIIGRAVELRAKL